jgi:hypothetical protein
VSAREDRALDLMVARVVANRLHDTADRLIATLEHGRGGMHYLTPSQVRAYVRALRALDILYEATRTTKQE